ncbi:MAG: sulfurtransferase TusA family protein [Theionarchaea archaeon]|nr:sulfurtransferase TusA family protein [Theionarchaea archaeon]
MNKESEILEVDVIGETCPVPLVEMRKAIRKASPGQIIRILGTHPASKKEIPMAAEELGLEVLEISDEEEMWIITLRIPGGKKDE